MRIIAMLLHFIGWIACHVFRFHSYRTVNESLLPSVQWFPRFTRYWTRTREQKCARCGAFRVLTGTRRVAKDWSRPERLFAK